jgi:DNA helicase HerA-like ATPase
MNEQPATGYGNGHSPEGVSNPAVEARRILGWVDGAGIVGEQRFDVVVADDAIVAVDDLVTTTLVLPNGVSLTHYGIVVSTSGVLEGASLASDTRRIVVERTMPGEAVRRVQVAVLRVDPELWMAPKPGAAVVAAVGAAREMALFAEHMDRPFPFGLDSTGTPVPLAFEYVDGTRGGHVNISGISGVATKTSTALSLLYLLFEGPRRAELLGPQSPNARAIVFAVKGEDLLHLDTPNGRFAQHPEALAGWAAHGIENPGPFTRVRVYGARSPHSQLGTSVAWVESRAHGSVAAYGWTPARFIDDRLFPYAFSDTDGGRNLVGFILERVTDLLARWAFPLAGVSGAVVLADPRDHGGPASGTAHRHELGPGDGSVVRNFEDLANWFTGDGDADSGVMDDAHPYSGPWRRNDAGGTVDAFLRRLHALRSRVGFLVDVSAAPIDLAEEVTVVDLHNLHETAQRFVVGATLANVFSAKQATGREPLRFVVLDELNKYAPREGTSPLKELLVDIAERGRSLGVILIGAQQAAGAVAPAIIRNAAVKIVGRLDAGEASEYRFLTPELRERATRFLPGTLILAQPLTPVPIPIRMPFPPFATSVEEARAAQVPDVVTVDAIAADLEQLV